MSVLGEIATALKTDIADMSRAQYDIGYSRQLTAHKFATKREEAKQRRDIESQAQKQRATLQLGLINKLYDQGRQTGDFSKGLLAMESENMNPEVKDYGKKLFEFSSGKSLETLKTEHQWFKDAQNYNLNQMKYNLEVNKYGADQQKYMTNLYFKQYESYVSQLEDQKDKFGQSRNKSAVQQFFNNPNSDPEMTTEQREKYQGLVNKPGVTWEYVQDRYNEYVNEQSSKMTEAGKDRRVTDKPMDIKTHKFLLQNYQKQSKDARTTLTHISEMENLLAQQKTGPVNKAVTTKVMQVFASNLRAMAEQEQWYNLGDLGERIVGGLTTYFGGKRTDVQFQEIKNLISEYKKEVTRAGDVFKADTWDRAKQLNVDPAFIFPDDNRYQLKKLDGKTYEIDTFRQMMREVQ